MFLLAYFLSGWKTAIILCLISLVGFFLFYKFLLLIVFFPLVGSCTRVAGDKIRCMVSSGQTHWDSHRESDRALGSFNPVPPLYIKEQASHVHSLWIFQFLTAVFKSHWFSIQLKGSSQCQIPGLGCPACALNASLSREAIQAIIFPSSSVDPPWGMYPNLITSLPFLPNSVWIFLRSLHCGRLSTSLQFVSSEKCSTCWFIFYVFVGVGELSTFLPCHLDLLLSNF